MKINFIDVGSRGILNKRWNGYIKHIITFDPSDPRGENTITKYSGNRYHFPYAVYDIEGEMEFNICRKYRASSLLEPDLQILKNTCYRESIENFKIIKTEKVRCIRLDTVLKDIKPSFDFLKVDAQGVDLNVLKSSGEFLKTFKAIEVECNLMPIYKGCPLFEDIEKYLNQKNFILIKKISSTGMKRNVWNDYLFLNIENKEKKFTKVLKEIY